MSAEATLGEELPFVRRIKHALERTQKFFDKNNLFYICRPIWGFSAFIKNNLFLTAACKRAAAQRLFGRATRILLASSRQGVESLVSGFAAILTGAS